MMLPDLTFTGARVLLPEGLADLPLAVAQGRIADLAQGPKIELDGHLILPGIVDIHGDGFERHLAPRRGALDSLEIGLSSLDAELAVNGITTAVLAQFWSWEGGMRGPDFARDLAEALDTAACFADMRLQLRLEIGMVETYDEALALIDRAHIPYVVLNDHLPHEALAAGKRPPRLTGQALKARRSPEAHLALMQRMHENQDAVPGAVGALCKNLAERGVLIGSHDARTPEDWGRSRAMGVHLSEFPETRAAAHAARTGGDGVVMGAPNIMRGGSHAGKVSALELLRDGLVDALASDYHYPALPGAALRLQTEGIDLREAWALVSEAPARLLGLADRGRIAPGLRADLVILEEASRKIVATIAGGVVSYLAGPVATRFLGARP